MARSKSDRKNEPKLSILLLTEDSGKHAHQVLETLSKKMLRLVDETCQTQRERMHFDPANDDARASMHANAWKGRNRRKLIILSRIIAERIAMHDGFVFFHADGDTTWTARSESENRQKFQRDVVTTVRKTLCAGGARAPSRSDEDVEALLKRLLLLMPFYSIEAWLYQNVDVGETLCHQHHGGKDAQRFAHWRTHRHEIDDIEKPKECVCLADKHNLDLATSAYPAKQAYEAGRSFTEAVDALRSCDELVAALAETSR